MSRRVVLGLALFAVALQAQAELKLETFKEKLDGAPVEVAVAREDGQGAPSEWLAAPLEHAYPAPGQALPEIASRLGLAVATNANFFREDKPGEQEPIGLSMHEGQLLSVPNKTYPSVGVINGKLEWDNVRVEATVELAGGGGSKREKLCRFNGRASKGCAALWLGKIPANVKNAVFISAQGLGPRVGRKTYDVKAAREKAWAIEWPGEVVEPGATATIEIKLKGERLGDKWQLAQEAVSGSHIITAKKTYPSLARSWAIARQPRTLIGADAQGLPFIAVFDGRREASRGISVRGAWTFVEKKLGAAWALNLDGGGSSTLLFEGQLANKPADGYPRPIAIGLGARPKAVVVESSPTPATH